MAKRSNQSESRARSDTRERILEATLAEAGRAGWGNVYLADVAGALRLPLSEVHRHFRDLDAVADAHFAQALAAMLEMGARVRNRPPAERIEALLGAWFAHLRPHAKTSAAMLTGKLYPFHPHHWVPLVFSLSRLIQWLRDAARLRAGLPRRQGEEIFLSALFLLALLAWRGEGEAGERRARALVARALQTLSMIL
ncbi:MAG: TetR/AcrR family transcriptional regulator [Rhodospirillales bacterium]|nr:TetR/AcrR family transcriptional regulator [Rhodospirillales bacterium]